MKHFGIIFFIATENLYFVFLQFTFNFHFAQQELKVF